ncbi:MAG: CAP domain-containing protein [Gemmataceae bacterium]|nr:CAP domain-containing protein [Gemmataceae bacterium]
MSRCAVLVCVFAVVFPVGARSDQNKDDKKAPALTAEEEAVVARTNEARKKADLKPLAVNPKLVEAARKHGENMARSGKLEHTLDDKNPTDRVKAAGYKPRLVGENIAAGQKDADEVVTGWLDSPVHRDNILDKNFTEIGVAAVKDDKGRVYWVQVFGQP